MIVDLFAGPGGWDLAARDLEVDPIGVEWEPSACATRAAAGLRTVRADVASYPPERFAGAEGLIASPPCPTFSKAGTKAGHVIAHHLHAAIREAAAGRDWSHHVVESAVTLGQGYQSDGIIAMSFLTVSVVDWLRVIRPRWVALENVPSVLPLWKTIARTLEVEGYSTWAGVLSAERYGVPQTRERAFLMAHRDRLVGPPAPTHQAFRTGHPAELIEGLFGSLAPWVSMADALGWTDDLRLNTGRDWPDDGSGRAGAQTIEATRPAPALTAKSGGQWQLTTPGPFTKLEPRPADSPAPTMTFGKHPNRYAWTLDRPATTLAGDPRIAQPGHKKEATSPDAPGRMEGSIPLEVREALIIQSFPADYPVRGTLTSKFRQIGNAVPPLLGRAVLGELILGGPSGPPRAKETR
jgi:DNA (cytosine-5)-methyltransferase 1